MNTSHKCLGVIVHVCRTMGGLVNFVSVDTSESPLGKGTSAEIMPPAVRPVGRSSSLWVVPPLG